MVAADLPSVSGEALLEAASWCSVDWFLSCLLFIEPIENHMSVPTISEWPLYQLATYYNYLLLVQAPVTDCPTRNKLLH